MEITAFEANVTLYGSVRKVRFDGAKLTVEPLAFGEVSWVLALLETAKPLDVQLSPVVEMPKPNGTNGATAPATAAAPPAATPPATRTRASNKTIATPPPAEKKADAAPAAPPPAVATPVVEAPPVTATGEKPGAPLQLAPPGVSNDDPILPTKVETAPPAVAGDLDMDYIRSTTKLKDIIEHMRQRGVPNDKLVERCTALKSEVAIISRIPNLAERIERTLEVMGG